MVALSGAMICERRLARVTKLEALDSFWGKPTSFREAVERTFTTEGMPCVGASAGLEVNDAELSDLANPIPVTYMPAEAFSKFRREGVFRSIWSTGATYHKRYFPTSCPVEARRATDFRLFGGAARELTTAGLATGEGSWDVFLRDFLPAHKAEDDQQAGWFVRWKPQVLKRASFTLGDSTQAMMAFTYTNDSLMSASKIASVYQMLVNGGVPEGTFNEKHQLYQTAGSVWGSRRLTPMVELQFHGITTFDDVENYSPTLDT